MPAARKVPLMPVRPHYISSSSFPDPPVLVRRSLVGLALLPVVTFALAACTAAAEVAGKRNSEANLPRACQVTDRSAQKTAY